MNCDRTPIARAVDFSAVTTGVGGRAMLSKHMLQYIHGVRGPRQTPLSKKQIAAWFRATPLDFVEEILAELVTAGTVRRVHLSLRYGRRGRQAVYFEINR